MSFIERSSKAASRAGTAEKIAKTLGALNHTPDFVQSVISNESLTNAVLSMEGLDAHSLNMAQSAADRAEMEIKNAFSEIASVEGLNEFNYQAGASIYALSGGNAWGRVDAIKDQSIQAALESASLTRASNEAYTPQEELAPRVSRESFDEKDMRNFLQNSVVLNVLASRQDKVNELFYRPINIAPDECGYAIEVRVEEVYQGYQHQPNGNFTGLNKVNLIDALVHPEVLESNATSIVPFVSATDDKTNKLYNKDHFVDATLFPPRTVSVDGISVPTSYLKVNMTHDLLGLTSFPELIANGLLNEKDTLDTKASLKSIALKVGDQAVVIPVSNLYRTSFVKSVEGNMNEMNLNFYNDSIVLDKDIKAVDGTEVTAFAKLKENDVRLRTRIRLTGYLFRDTGVCEINGSNVIVVSAAKGDEELALDDTTVAPIVEELKTKIEVVGYEIDVNRSNSSLRTRGRLIDSTLVREIVAVQLRAPISIEKPIVGGTKAEPQLSALINAVRIQANNAGISTLFRFAETLETVTSRNGYNYSADRNSIPGIARHFIQPVLIREEIDLREITNSPASESKLKDIQGAVTTKLNEVVGRAIQQSNYIAVVDQMGGNNSNIQVIAATDYRIPQFMAIQGDVRLFGSKLNFQIESTPNKHMRGKIVLSLSRKSTANEVDPFEFGNLLWSSELMVQKEMDRGQQTFMRDMIQPRYAHSINVPILIIIDVKGIEEVAGNAVQMPVRLVDAQDKGTGDAAPVGAPAAGQPSGASPSNPKPAGSRS